MRYSALALIALLGCAEPALVPVIEGEPNGLLGVSGTSSDDVWVVGADSGDGPTALHFDGAAWTRLNTGTTGDLWWVQALDDGTVFMAGENATVIRVQDGTFERLHTPGPGKRTVFGVWASSADDVWAVGAHAGRAGFVWHFDGTDWTEMRLPLDIPRREDGELPSMLKVWGDGDGTVWVVGDRGTVLRSRFGGPLVVVPTPTTARFFSVTGRGDDVIAVGEDVGAGVVVEYNKDTDSFDNVTPGSVALLQGVTRTPVGDVVAVGQAGEVLRRRGGGWSVDDDATPLLGGSLHAAWSDDSGEVWSVGGNVLTTALDDGVLMTTVEDVPSIDPLPEPDPDPEPICPADAIDLAPNGSVAHGWNEQNLDAIRRSIPHPGVHARNLYHTSLAMWDAWAAYDAVATGVVVDESASATDIMDAQEVALSFAAHEVLSSRYATANGGPTSLACFDAYMRHLGLDPANDTVDGDSPVALGNRIGKTILERFFDDGANEANGYVGDYEPVNPLLTVDSIRYEPTDPSRWSPLNLAVAVTQNGIPADSGTQTYLGPHWGWVEPFALERPADGGSYFEGDLPQFDDPEMTDWVVTVIQRTSWLDTTDGVMIDISPGAIGNNDLGTDNGSGHPVNPVTDMPYEPNLVRRGDFGRVLAEFWADGPHSETPPGHWNTIANTIAEDPDFEFRLYGERLVDELEWDVSMYLTLNGAVHDAAIAAWELKRASESARPIALIRYKAALGQSSDPSLPNYHEDGLPLIPGVIELVTEGSSLPGERHEHLRHFQDSVVIWTWRGEPGDDDTEFGGQGWVRGIEWMPYQRRTFVSPAFPGYVSGHSTFSRAAATALTELTASPYFPGGLGTFTATQNDYLVFEQGPSETIQLQWATYADAADQAGQSRLWGGIHITPDDFDGRVIGETVGLLAVEEARRYIDGE